MENQEQNREPKDEKITPKDLSLSAKATPAESRRQDEEHEKSALRLKLENFLYYYKWHTLAALFILLVIVVCTLQMCRKTTVDCYVLYAGAKNVEKVGYDGDVSEYETCLSSLRLYAEDGDGDGKKTISLETLYLLSPDEKAGLQAELAAGGYQYSLNETQLYENAASLVDSLLAGDAYLCLLSEFWLDANEDYFCDLSAYVSPSDPEKKLTASGLGIYLSSTSLAEKPGFDSFPEDTVICLRKLSAVGGNRAKQNYESGEAMLRSILRS